jgi:hypothetical protein
VIKFLAYEYAYSNTPNKCSGGVLGLAGVAVGLGIVSSKSALEKR